MTQNFIGAPIIRAEDVRFLTGQGKYLDDIKLPGMLHAAILRSSYGHARIRSVDTAAALALPGVAAVFTYADIASIAKVIPVRVFEITGLADYLQVPLADSKVRYVGEPVAVIVADNRYIAEDALELVEVDYEPLPAVTEVKEALKDEVVLHEENGSNQAGSYELNTGDIDGAFRNAEYVRKEEFRTHRHTGNPLETRGLLADFNQETGQLTAWGPTKVPHFNRAILANHLEIPEDNIHFIEPDVGGGFGIRGEFYAEDFLIPFASMRLGRPVKWTEDRMEHLISANHSREVVCEVELAAKKDGTILGMRANITGDMGAYVRTHGCVVPALTAGMLPGPYRVPAYRADFNCVMTNKMGTGTYRAPGFYEACFIRERLLDIVAADLDLDPAEFRKMNLIQASEMPYTVGATRIDGRQTIYDSGDYPSAFNRALEEIGYESIKGNRSPDDQGRLHGVGVASYVEPTGFGPYEGARIVATKEGLIEVYLGITTLGQGHETIMAQICADSLGMPMDRIRIFHGNTDYLPASIGTFGSRATVMAGSAIHLASQTLQERILEVAAGYMDTETTALEFGDGRVSRKSAEASADSLDIAQIVALAESGEIPDGQETALEATEYFRVEEWTYSYGSHVAHVAVDPTTGKLDVLRYVVVEDVGRCINPLTMHGQSVGGAVQGIGGTILEELVYDDSGQLVSGSFMDYLLPTSQDVPNIDSVILEEAPSPLNPLGVKGAGEGAILATGAALSNAVADALSEFNVHITSLPLSPNNIRNWIHGAPEK